MDFKGGDTVRLRSGGPLMTVEQVAEMSYGGTGVWCVWFDRVANKQVVGRDTFDPIVLERSEKTPVTSVG